jgi:hypothetical protein
MLKAGIIKLSPLTVIYPTLKVGKIFGKYSKINDPIQARIKTYSITKSIGSSSEKSKKNGLKSNKKMVASLLLVRLSLKSQKSFTLKL